MTDSTSAGETALTLEQAARLLATYSPVSFVGCYRIFTADDLEIWTPTYSGGIGNLAAKAPLALLRQATAICLSHGPQQAGGGDVKA